MGIEDKRRHPPAQWLDFVGTATVDVDLVMHFLSLYPLVQLSLLLYMVS
jgi:hypothetical protein